MFIKTDIKSTPKTPFTYALLLSLGLSLTFMTGCSKKPEEMASPSDSANSAMSEMSATDAAAAATDAAASASDTAAPSAVDSSATSNTVDTPPATTATPAQQLSAGTSTSTAIVGDRKFIRTVEAQFQVKDVYQASNVIEDAVNANGGFITQNNITAETTSEKNYPNASKKTIITQQAYIVRGDLIVRLPSDRTESFLRTIATQIEFLESKNYSAKDASIEILRAQLEALRNQQAKTSLNTARATQGNVDAQYNYSTNADEAKLTKKQFLDQVAFSTLHLNMFQTEKVRKSEAMDVRAEFESARPNFFYRMFDSILVGWNAVLDVIVTLFIVWPLFVILGLGWYLIKRFKKPSKKNPPITIHTPNPTKKDKTETPTVVIPKETNSDI